MNPIDRTDPAGMFVDEFHPTPDELRRWAHSHAAIPKDQQDWELFIADDAGVLVELVDDPTSDPIARWLFLTALYVAVGDATRPWEGRPIRSDITAAIADAADRCPPLQRWAERSQRLIAGDEEYVNDNWGLSCAYSNVERPWFDSNSA